MNKPIGRKAYGSIPHLPNSRMGPGDHSCHAGQEVICCEKPRDKNDRIIVTEKMDGSCMSVANIGGHIIALGRAGYLAASAPFPHLVEFVDFVKKNEARFAPALADGQRFVGEWMNVATGTFYKMRHEPFVIFDLMEGERRLPFDQMCAAAAKAGFETAHLVSDGPAIPISDALALIGEYGFHGAQETVEGAVWRVERNGEFDFIAKFVRHNKIDGKYLPGLYGNETYLRNSFAEGVPSGTD